MLEADAILNSVYSHMLSRGCDESENFCARFEWQQSGDLLVIDNARMLHRATTAAMPEGSRRKMLRVSIRGERPVVWVLDRNRA